MNKKTKRIESIFEFLKDAQFETCPLFPKKMLFEISNICNHKCVFCAYKKMTRPKGVVDPNLFKDIVQQAYELGIKEIGLHSGAEPFACKNLEYFVEICSKIGFEYIYLSTNGTLATQNRIKRVLDAGLHSIKFSINAGDRETYKKIHGKDQFDIACQNVFFTNEYRKKLNRQIYLAVSFIEVDENTNSFAKLLNLFEPVVNEVFRTKAVNQSGQVPEFSSFFKERNLSCVWPFKTINVSREGFLRACCNDYQNFLALEDLRLISLKEAWHSKRFIDFRNNFLCNNAKNTLCYNCLYGVHTPIEPLNRDLCPYEQI